MHELTDHELYQALTYAKSIDEENGKKILIRFQNDQTMLSQTLFNMFPMMIAQQNQDMANLFMDLCFDIICVYEKAFGQAPLSSNDPAWLKKQSAFLETELQALIPAQAGAAKTGKGQQETLTQADESTPQKGLVKFLNEAVDDYASESPSRVGAIKITQAMILVVIRLFNSLYKSSTTH